MESDHGFGEEYRIQEPKICMVIVAFLWSVQCIDVAEEPGWAAYISSFVLHIAGYLTNVASHAEINQHRGILMEYNIVPTNISMYNISLVKPDNRGKNFSTHVSSKALITVEYRRHISKKNCCSTKFAG